MRIAVCRPQVPFVYGGAELMADTLVSELRARGYDAETVSIPFKWYPGTRVLDQAFLWRLVDLTEADDRPIDRVIATKFPAYCVRHPNKVAWVLHQFRQAYEYDRTELGQFDESAEDRALRRKLHQLEERRGSDRTVDRHRGGGAAAPAAGARLPLRGLRRLHPLGQPARPREA